MSDVTLPVACCNACGAPLISTLVFPHAEFYCLECGRRYGFLDPRPVARSPDLDIRLKALEDEWHEHAAPFLRMVSGWVQDCEACRPHHEYHSRHATTEERVAHHRALAWLAERAKTHEQTA